MASDEMASLPPGNTKLAASDAKAKNWQLTLNEVKKYDQLKEYLTSLKSLTYLISCKEIAPSTGHEHIHIFCQFKNMIKLSIKKCCGAHIERCQGTPQQNVAYIKKDGNIIDEIGEVRNHGGRTIAEVKKMTSVEREELPIQYYNIVEKINAKESNDIRLDDIYKPDIEVHWICGPSGVGKTKKAFDICREHGYETINMVKYENGFWNGIGTSECAVYDEFRDSHMKPSEFINFIDYNIHPLNIKGGHEMNRYKFIIITSVQDPEFIYMNVEGEPRKQWMRRMKIDYITGYKDLGIDE